MSSTIDTIYSALDGMAVTYLDMDNTSVTATCYTLSEALDSVQTGHMPCRILLLPNVSMTLGPGSEASAVYTVRDLFLLDTVAQGDGSKVMSPVLLKYVKAYEDAIAKKWQWLSTWQTEAFTTSVTIAPGKYEYPVQSGVTCYGVMVTLTISEIF